MPELTVASTTDTQKEIDAVAGSGLVEPEEQIEQPTEGDAEPEEKREPEPEESEGEEKPHPKSAFQKRIDRLRREKGDLEREVEELRKFKAEKTRPAAQVEPKPQPEVEAEPLRAKPKLEDTKEDGSPKYASYEEWVEDLADWKVEQREATRAEREYKTQLETRAQEQISAYNDSVESFKDEHPDFDKVVGQDVRVPQAAVDAIIRLGNPAVAYHLGQHPELCEELSENVDDPLYVVTRIGQIAAQLDTQVTEPQESEQEEEPAPKPKAVSKAPAPISPVRGSSTKSSIPIDEMSYADFRRIREQQIKNRFRR